MQTSEIEVEIKKLLQPLCPNVDLSNDSSMYHTRCIKDLVNHFEKLGSAKEPVFALSLSESIRVDILNNVIEQIKKDLIEDKHNFLWSTDAPKDDYERGVQNVIRLIMHRVHCICD